jgi:hypothetical protein
MRNAAYLQIVVVAMAIVLTSALSVLGQAFEINSISAGNGTVQVGFPGRSDSYYFLQSRTSLSKSSAPTPLAALLGSSGNLTFQTPTAHTNAMFFQVEQIPLTSSASLANDGLPDAWKLQHGLNPIGPSPTNQIASGSVLTWLQLYKSETNLAALPLAYFPVSTSTFVVGSTNAAVQVAFTKPYTGFLTYQLSGTAVPASTGVTGDYVAPSGSVYVPNSTTASILIKLVPEPDIEVNRSIVVAISAPPQADQTYAITTNSSITTLQIVQSTNGVFVGNLAISNGMFAGVQSVKMALRSGSCTNTMALFDVTGNAMLGNTFAVKVSANTNGFQLSGAKFSNVLTNTPWGRNLNVNLSFGSTQTSNNITFTTPVTIGLVGLTASGLSYSGTGFLTVSRSQ